MPKFKNEKAPKWNMRRGMLIFGIFLFLILVAPMMKAAGPTYIISNSAKWTDVYSVVLYSNLIGLPNSFLTSTSAGNYFLTEINKGNFIRVISSTNQPYVLNYPSMIRSAGFAGADEITGNNLNLNLVNYLTNTTDFVVVGDAFGYNAIAVTPYALQKKAWVFLANQNNIYQIDSVLSKRNVKSLLIYGYVDPAVTSVLSKYHPTTINTGDRFNDNIAIVKKYIETTPAPQVVLTNGEFLEQEIMSGSEPILFTGQQNVPSQISSWLKNSTVKVGVLIGNDLVDAATNIRASTGISVMVKFARSARSQGGGGVAPVEGLDLFPVPTPTMLLNLHSVNYNKVTSQLDVTYRSASNIPIYIKGTITVNDNGNQIRTGDLNPIFMTPGEYKTIVYPINLTTQDQNMTAQVYTLYGETPNGLELILNNQTNINLVEVIDGCKLTEKNILGVSYNKQQRSIFVKIKNTNNIDCWAGAQINNIQIGYSTETIGTNGATIIPAGRTGSLEIKQVLSDTDIQNNPNVDLSVFSGEKEDNLVNTLEGNFPLNVEMFTILTYSIIAVILLIIGLVILLVMVKKNKKNYY